MKPCSFPRYVWQRLEELTVGDLSLEQRRRALSSLTPLADNVVAATSVR